MGSLQLKYEGFEDFDEEVTKAIDTIKSDDEAPLFGDFWPSAKALCQYIENSGAKDMTVLELGCGLALPSIVASLKGARTVIASDYHKDCQVYVEKNCQLNGVENLSYQQLDWRDDVQLKAMDLIVASDILYEPKIYDDLASFIWQCCHDKSKVIIADPERVFREDFDKAMEAQGLKMKADWKEGKTKMTIWETR